MKNTALITGASRGIGRATAILFAQRGFRVIINYQHSRDAAESLATSLCSQGYCAMACRADVTNRHDVQQMVDECSKKFSAPDVLIHNAGIGQQKLFTDITDQEWDRMMDVHVKGLYHTCQCVLPAMISRKSGKIVTVSSIWGMVGASCEVHYSAAKAAVIGMTKALAKEVGPSNIQVNCVAPGIIRTDMNAALTDEDIRVLKDETPMQRLGTPEEVAECIYWLASDQAGFITGQIVSPNGGFVI